MRNINIIAFEQKSYNKYFIMKNQYIYVYLKNLYQYILKNQHITKSEEKNMYI